MPDSPFGINGVQFSGLIQKNPVITKAKTTAILITTSTPVIFLDSCIPLTKVAIIKNVINNPGILTQIGIPKNVGITVLGSIPCFVSSTTAVE